ncbi:hypothetical protein [Rubrimonas cliftonensis]|uniref:Uncharacterized protein n=1 Tax=Rubrimonas cliftonensis TaxID=89524 RepID=A0A1H3W2Y0_9RHOB|nr:hypothetical protein [Rubrimonas cliftonensis]SDZ81515.1 hypothetical protein SAMN05444370_101489 [Rubrimonas cliftonensis]
MARVRGCAPLLLLAVAVLGGCAAEGGLIEPPLVSLETGDPVADGRGLALIADGRRVALAPPADLCVRSEALHADGAAAVAQLAPCDAAIRPTVMRMISVSAASLAPQNALGEALDLMAAEAASPGGWRALGLGLGPPLNVLSATREGDAVFVVVEDATPAGALAIGRRCRAISQINERLVVVTVAALRSAAAPSAQRLQMEAARILAAVRDANPAPPRPASRAERPPVASI